MLINGAATTSGVVTIGAGAEISATGAFTQAGGSTTVAGVLADLAEPGGAGRRVMEMRGLVALEPDVALGLVGGEIIEDDLDFAFRIGGDNGVHEVEEFDAPASLVVTGDDFAAGHVERGKLISLFGRQYDRRRFTKAAHAALNHDSWTSDSGY
jgi:hypothetical protein